MTSSGAEKPTIERESDLYAPVKGYLEGLGFSVRGEVGHCDMLAVQGDTLVAVELKLSLGLPVLFQAIARMPAVDAVYVAVAVPDGRRARGRWDGQAVDATRLCRMLGLGLLAVRDGRVVVHCDPTPYAPRKQPRKRLKLLGEFKRRSGDHNTGGSSRRPVVTAYREDALRCAALLARHDALSPAEIRKATGVKKAGALLLRNVYGWFERIGHGRYAIAPAGREALLRYADVLAAQSAPGEEA